MKAERAGHKAPSIRQLLETHPEAGQVDIVKPSMGSWICVKEFDLKEQQMPWDGPHARDVLSVET